MFYCWDCGLYWSAFHVSLRRMHILLFLDEIVYICQLRLVNWWCCWVQLCSHWYPVWWISISNKDLLNSPIVIVDWSVSLCNSFSFCITDTVVMHTHVNNCYTFLENWVLHHYVMSLFIYDNFPLFKICLVWDITTHALFF